MKGLRPSARGRGSGPERRRSTRIHLSVPVDVAWTEEDGSPASEHARTEVLNAHGALLQMKSHLPLPIEVQLSRPRTSLVSTARVVGFRERTQEGLLRVAVELEAPSESFWGVWFPSETSKGGHSPKGRAPAHGKNN